MPRFVPADQIKPVPMSQMPAGKFARFLDGRLAFIPTKGAVPLAIIFGATGALIEEQQGDPVGIVIEDWTVLVDVDAIKPRKVGVGDGLVLLATLDNTVFLVPCAWNTQLREFYDFGGNAVTNPTVVGILPSWKVVSGTGETDQNVLFEWPVPKGA